jgi:predicted transcriptional regulator
MVTSAQRSNRGRIEIMADILSMSSIGMRKTRVMFGANLSFEQVTFYLGELVAKGLLDRRMVEEEVLYITTKRGKEFLNQFMRVHDLMSQRPEEPSPRYTPSATQ